MHCLIPHLLARSCAAGSQRIFAGLLWACAALSSPHALAQKPGCVAAIGGALARDNRAVWERLIQEAGGPGSRFVVFASAADDPERSAKSLIETLERYGAKAEAIPVAVNLKSTDWKKAVQDPALINIVKSARGVYFAGGSQERITQVLLDAGQATEMLKAIQLVRAQGGIIAGSSAGAAVMSATMFNDPQPVLDILRGGIRTGQDVAAGLGFLRKDILVDQHFLKRGRIGRLLPALHHAGLSLGVGVDENTAAFFCGNTLEVVGASGVLVADMRAAKVSRTAPFALQGAELSLLLHGDRLDMETLQLTPASERAGRPIDPRRADFKPYHRSTVFITDILGADVLPQLMGRLLDSDASEATGLAFDAARLRPEAGTGKGKGKAPGDKDRAGFEFRLYKGPASTGWFSSHGGEHYSVQRLLLDIRPLRMAYPLYTQDEGAAAGAASPGRPAKSPPAPTTRQ